jgi:DNA-binding ferritin-like protein (Dps family)
MYYWVKDELDREWRVLLVGIYEKFEDGTAIVSELDVVEYYLEGKIYTPADVPDEITGFVDSLLDDKDTYIDIQREYEKEGQHLL